MHRVFLIGQQVGESRNSVSRSSFFYIFLYALTLNKTAIKYLNVISGMPSTIKRKISLNGVSSETCQIIYTYDMSLFDRIICAGGMEGRDTCIGDSGGPLMKKVEEDYQTNWYLFGITSYGPYKCGSEGRPSIYTKVSAYMDWIQSIVTT